MTPTSVPNISPDNEKTLSIYNVLLSSDFGIWQWEPATDAFFFNKRFMTMLGYEHSTFPFHISTWENLIHTDDRDKIVGAQRRILTAPDLGDSFEHRFRLRSASGDFLWILSRGFVICRDENGQALRVSGMHIDLRTMDNVLKEMGIQHDRMGFALETGNDGLWDWNPQEEIVYFSPSYIGMLGYTPEQFPPHVSSWSSRVHPEDLDATVKRQYEHISNPRRGDRFECVYRFLDADGDWRWILGRGKVVTRNAEGKATRIVGLHTDITDLRNVQDDLSQMLNTDNLTKLHSRFFFDCALDLLKAEDYPVSIIYADIDGLKLVNDNMGHVVGDKLLSIAADILGAGLAGNGIAARVGGDEFAILLTKCVKKEASKVLKGVYDRLNRHNAQPGVIPVFMATGMISAETEMPRHKLLALADSAMLRDKAERRLERHEIIKQWIKQQIATPVSFEDSRL